MYRKLHPVLDPFKTVTVLFYLGLAYSWKNSRHVLGKLSLVGSQVLANE